MTKIHETTLHKGVEVQLCAYDYAAEAALRSELTDPSHLTPTAIQARDENGVAVQGCYITMPMEQADQSVQ